MFCHIDSSYNMKRVSSCTLLPSLKAKNKSDQLPHRFKLINPKRITNKKQYVWACKLVYDLYAIYGLYVLQTNLFFR